GQPETRRTRRERMGSSDTTRLEATRTFAAFHRAPDIPWCSGAPTISGSDVARSTALLKNSSALFPATPNRRTTRASNGFSSHNSSADAALVTAEATNSGGSVVAEARHRGTAVFASRTAVYPAKGSPNAPAPSPAASPIAASGPLRYVRNSAETL